MLYSRGMQVNGIMSRNASQDTVLECKSTLYSQWYTVDKCKVSKDVKIRNRYN